MTDRPNKRHRSESYGEGARFGKVPSNNSAKASANTYVPIFTPVPRMCYMPLLETWIKRVHLIRGELHVLLSRNVTLHLCSAPLFASPPFFILETPRIIELGCILYHSEYDTCSQGALAVYYFKHYLFHSLLSFTTLSLPFFTTLCCSNTSTIAARFTTQCRNGALSEPAHL